MESNSRSGRAEYEKRREAAEKAEYEKRLEVAERQVQTLQRRVIDLESNIIDEDITIRRPRPSSSYLNSYNDEYSDDVPSRRRRTLSVQRRVPSPPRGSYSPVRTRSNSRRMSSYGSGRLPLALEYDVTNDWDDDIIHRIRRDHDREMMLDEQLARDREREILERERRAALRDHQRSLELSRYIRERQAFERGMRAADYDAEDEYEARRLQNRSAREQSRLAAEREMDQRLKEERRRRSTMSESEVYDSGRPQTIIINNSEDDPYLLRNEARQRLRERRWLRGSESARDSGLMQVT